MDNASLITLSYQLAAYRSMDVIANNIANVSTPGFKRESPKFEELLERVKPTGDSGSQRSLSFVRDAGVVRDLSNGPMISTGSPFDLAIAGKGFFSVQTAAGVRYTRDGHFTLNADGTVVDSQGNPLLGDGGPITISVDDGNVTFGADGTITGKQGQIGKLQVVDFPNERAMTKQGASLYATTQTPVPAANAKVEQGMLEGSNVQPVIEISHMIELMRSYQAIATMETSAGDLKRQAIQKLGTVQ